MFPWLCPVPRHTQGARQGAESLAVRVGGKPPFAAVRGPAASQRLVACERCRSCSIGDPANQNGRSCLREFSWLARCVFSVVVLGKRELGALSDHYVSLFTSRVCAGLCVNLHIHVAVKRGHECFGGWALLCVFRVKEFADEVTSCIVSFS